MTLVVVFCTVCVKPGGGLSSRSDYLGVRGGLPWGRVTGPVRWQVCRGFVCHAGSAVAHLSLERGGRAGRPYRGCPLGYFFEGARCYARGVPRAVCFFARLRCAGSVPSPIAVPCARPAPPGLGLKGHCEMFCLQSASACGGPSNLGRRIVWLNCQDARVSVCFVGLARWRPVCDRRGCEVGARR